MSIQAHALECPRCHAPLAPSRFARQTVCPYCGATVRVDPSAVETRRFREALAGWNDPSRHGFSQWLTLEGRHWSPAGLLARGATCDVYLAQRARWPTQWVVLKLLREPSQAARFEQEGARLTTLARAPFHLGVRAPALVQRGTVSAGLHAGKAALLYLHEPDFPNTFEAVRQALPRGVDPRCAIWMWRRVLELLSALHQEGLAHGAITPPHLLVQENDHGVRAVGFGCAGPFGSPVAARDPRYPGPEAGGLSAQRDVQMSARCMAYVLGGDFTQGDVPASVPEPLARCLREVASGQDGSGAWPLRERLGALARQLFGAPSFHPLVLPRGRERGLKET